MNTTEDPRTVQKRRYKTAIPGGTNQTDGVDADWLKSLCRAAGADDVGLVEIDRPELAEERKHLLSVFPRTKTLISFVCRLNREPIRSPARSVANMEFHKRGEDVNEVGHKIVENLERTGIRAINPAMGFPMEMQRFPGRIWLVSHKTVAAAAGLGQMGIHRNVIHPKFGNFILLGTVLLDREVSKSDYPIDYNPCLECKLCVAACPTGAIAADGHFDFSACYTHNYREFMGGFTDWVENIADSKNASQYREKVSDPESVSMWQSLSFGANYKAAYCMSVCPAGEDVIALYLHDKKEFLNEVVKPLQEKEEPVYVVANSDAEQFVQRRFKTKWTKRIGNGLRPQSIHGFITGLPLVFQRDQSKDVDAVYHFTFHGEEETEATVTIRNQALKVSSGHNGKPDFILKADSVTWLRFLAGEAGLFWALLRGKIRIMGSPKLLKAFAKCFPS